MSIHWSVLTSCRISDSGNRASRSAGPTGSFVAGWSGCNGCIPAWTIDGMMLNHDVGIRSCGRSKRVSSVTATPPSPGGRSLAAPLGRRHRRSGDRRRRDLDPAVNLARAEQGQRVARRAVDRLARLEVEHALAFGARDLRGAVVERALGERAPVPGADLGEGEQTPLVVRDPDTPGGQIERADLPLGDLREGSHTDELGLAHAPRTARNARCRTVAEPSTARSRSTGSIIPGISRPTASAITRSSRWKIPSVSTTFAASASARTWLTATDTTSVINASTAARVWPSAASRQNKHENRTMSEIRSS